MILGYLLFLPYQVMYQIRRFRDYVRTKVKG